MGDGTEAAAPARLIHAVEGGRMALTLGCEQDRAAAAAFRLTRLGLAGDEPPTAEPDAINI